MTGTELGHRRVTCHLPLRRVSTIIRGIRKLFKIYAPKYIRSPLYRIIPGSCFIAINFLPIFLAIVCLVIFDAKSFAMPFLQNIFECMQMCECVQSLRSRENNYFAQFVFQSAASQFLIDNDLVSISVEPIRYGNIDDTKDHRIMT